MCAEISESPQGPRPGVHVRGPLTAAGCDEVAEAVEGALEHRGGGPVYLDLSEAAPIDQSPLEVLSALADHLGTGASALPVSLRAGPVRLVLRAGDRPPHATPPPAD